MVTPVRSFGWSQEPAGVEPHHDHPERALGACRGSCERVQSDLCPRRWRSRERGKTGGEGHCPLLRLRDVSPLPFIVSGLDAVKGVVLIQQEKVSAGTSSTILRSLQPDTVYTVSLVPVYAEGDGKTVSENGKTSELPVVLLNK